MVNFAWVAHAGMKPEVKARALVSYKASVLPLAIFFDNGLSKALLLNVSASYFAPCHNHNYSSLVSGWKHGGFLLYIFNNIALFDYRKII